MQIKRKGLKDYDEEIVRATHRLLHDTTLPEDELEERLIEEAKRLRESISRNTKQKIADLVKQLEGIS